MKRGRVTVFWVEMVGRYPHRFGAFYGLGINEDGFHFLLFNFQKELKLGTVILTKKYRTLIFNKEIFWAKNAWLCRHHSSLQCSCAFTARLKVESKYGVHGFTLLDHCPRNEGWDPQYDMCGSICSYCKNGTPL